MAKSSSLGFILVAVGGVAVGFLAAQVVPLPEQPAEEALSEQAGDAEQPPLAGALVGLEKLTLDERLRGEITSASELNGNDGSRFKRYMISLDEGEVVEISLAGALQGVVALYDDQLELLDNAATVRHRIDESGDYMVVVSGADAHSYGPFSVESRTVELTQADTIAVGEPVDSWLQGDAHEISLTIDEAGLYQLNMRSDDFDAYLEVEGPNGYTREDDDSAGNLDARIADFLASGDYTLTARSAFGDGNGVYTLSVEPHELPDEGQLRNDGALTPGEVLSGWYSGESLTYQLTVEESSLVTLEMRSSDFDTFLEISGQGVAASDDDGAGGTDSRLQESLLPGTYTVIASGFSAAGSGLFELDVDSQPTNIAPEL
ncbi:hypothetical protein [Halovibrio sp. HP20-50]|uniref:hypothetical protein n=1 Tax=Halovibrio sp. HP20-59 TaxID=3080275 RepID=UPI00294B2F16|nr:hypothetical protein [Halovibrio sp. HP20-59]MEA2119022.1 hypothetical protein [Halovibrio sp. HP20-59]